MHSPGGGKRILYFRGHGSSFAEANTTGAGPTGNDLNIVMHQVPYVHHGVRLFSTWCPTIFYPVSYYVLPGVRLFSPTPSRPAVLPGRASWPGGSGGARGWPPSCPAPSRRKGCLPISCTTRWTTRATHGSRRKAKMHARGACRRGSSPSVTNVNYGEQRL